MNIYSKDYPIGLYRKLEEIPLEVLNKIAGDFFSIFNKKFVEKKKIRILLIGMGYGRIEIPILERFINTSPQKKDIIAIDISEKMTAEFANTWEKKKIASPVNVITDDFNNYSFGDKKFDIVFSFFSFHLLGEKKKTIRKLVNLLNAEGLLVIPEETGDYLFLENNIIVDSQTNYNYYTLFWKCLHRINTDLIIGSTHDVLSTIKNIDFGIISNSIEYSWEISNIDYSDLSKLLSGKARVFNFLNSKDNYINFLNFFLCFNNLKDDDLIERKEGHKFYFISKTNI